jgi:hypothetical protein
MAEEKFDYSKAMKELEDLAAKVEDPKTCLDDIGTLVKKSKKLIEDCRKYLRSIRETVDDIDSNK